MRIPIRPRPLLAALLLLLAAALCTGCSARLTASDIDALTGPPWVGTLTYLDYTSNRHTTIDSSLMVRRSPSSPTATSSAAPTFPSWVFGYGYSKEPHADSSSTLALTDDGRIFGDETVVSRVRTQDGILRYTTESRGQDNDRPALFRFEHTLTPHQYTRRKLVRFDGEPDFFERHVYQWSR